MPTLSRMLWLIVALMVLNIIQSITIILSDELHSKPTNQIIRLSSFVDLLAAVSAFYWRLLRRNKALSSKIQVSEVRAIVSFVRIQLCSYQSGVL